MELDGPRLPGVPRAQLPPPVDPAAGVDWTKEPFHRAFFQQPLNRDGLPAGLVVWIYVAIVAGLVWGAYAAVQWWTTG